MKDRFSNGYIVKTAGIMLIVSGIMFFLFETPGADILGWVFGCLISMAMFKQLYFTLMRAVEKSERGASRYAGIHYALRYAIYAVVLVVAAKAEYLSLATTFFGLLSVKYVILAENGIRYLRERKGGGI